MAPVTPAIHPPGACATTQGAPGQRATGSSPSSNILANPPSTGPVHVPGSRHATPSRQRRKPAKVSTVTDKSTTGDSSRPHGLKVPNKANCKGKHQICAQRPAHKGAHPRCGGGGAVSSPHVASVLKARPIEDARAGCRMSRTDTPRARAGPARAGCLVARASSTAVAMAAARQTAASRPQTAA